MRQWDGINDIYYCDKATNSLILRRKEVNITVAMVSIYIDYPKNKENPISISLGWKNKKFYQSYHYFHTPEETLIKISELFSEEM